MGIGLEILWPIGAAILFGVLFYYGRQSLTRAERRKTDAAVRANWGKEEIH
jgi:hypothetical protein